jgi:hypothetical protein
MIDMLGYLEPVYFERGTMIINELDEFGEVIFISKGVVSIGYEINKIKKFCIQYNGKCVIGGFGVTFNQRATFMYSATTHCEGHFIRQRNWHELLSRYMEIADRIKTNVLVDYVMNIRIKVTLAKRKDI